MPLIGGVPYPAFGERGAFTVGTRRDVFRGVADMTTSGETANDLDVRNGRIVNRAKSDAARARYMGPAGARLRARNACAAANCGPGQLAQYADAPLNYVPIQRGRGAGAAAQRARLAGLRARMGMVGNGMDDDEDEDLMGGRKGRGRRQARQFFKGLGRGLKRSFTGLAQNLLEGGPSMLL